MLDRIRDLDVDLERMNPNMKAIERLEGVENRLQDTEKEFERARKNAKSARDRFNSAREKRYVRNSTQRNSKANF